MRSKTRKHLTTEQRQTLRQLFDECDVLELLHGVAGVLLHDVTDFSSAEEAAKSVLNAAHIVRQSMEDHM